ncbi:winged helix-turn-helix domain-containing protein [Thermovenabulum gondwanense]|uniref:Stage 0 sporulation protein A homolog n=1 Tax=Thermovenabulum gondwanense TaxID=520767 RepID=A0A161PV05_9FIRM|nr:response regulator transcription factor [Thermovenabulum gondwanense]KYO66696.1 Alkaline phosphatase synthesis transcriptional regulatory protein PhoP [Thermovenabulum gondwanense]
MANEKILIVDDEPNILELLKFNLENNGFKVIKALNGEQALELIKLEKPDLILLDVMLPGIDGYELCKILRRKTDTSEIPIILITAKNEEIDRILGLEIGADDYITKPFSVRELVARVKAVLRRVEKKDKGENTIRISDICIEVDKFEVTVDGRKIDLTPKEFELLKLFAQNPGRVFSRDYLLERIWGYDYLGDTRTVDVHIRHLRQKLGDEQDEPKYIETIRGIGYKFKEK